MCKELPEIVYFILNQGHYINITNNGTMSNQLEKIIERSQGMLSRLCFAFSLHYIELKKRNVLDTFVADVHKVRDAGCSFLIQLNLAVKFLSGWQTSILYMPMTNGQLDVCYHRLIAKCWAVNITTGNSLQA